MNDCERRFLTACVAVTANVMLDACGMQPRKTLIGWRRCWWSYVSSAR